MEYGFSGVLCGIDDIKEVCYSGNYIIIITPSLNDAGYPFDIIVMFRILFYLILFSPILGQNAPLRLRYHSHVDTWRGVWVQPTSIVLVWSSGETYHTLSIHLHIDCLDLMKR